MKSGWLTHDSEKSLLLLFGMPPDEPPRRRRRWLSRGVLDHFSETSTWQCWSPEEDEELILLLARGA